MGINTKIAKIPFFVLYLIPALSTSFNWIRVILFQKSFDSFQASQPWDHYLSKFFADNLGITQKEYFIFAFPIMLIFLYLIPKLFGKLMNTDKTSNIKGDNHVAVLIILLIIPSILGLQRLFPFGLRSRLIPGIILISIFSILSWIDEKDFKNRN